MDKLKRIFIKVTYQVAYEDIDLPENVKAELIAAAEKGHAIKGASMKYPAALEWLNSEVSERDCMDWQYEIHDIKE